MKSLLVLTLVLAATQSALASTDPAKVAQLDRQREGNLKSLVIAEYQKQIGNKCEGPEVMKIDALKITAESFHQTKTPGTPYDYSATYLVTVKCHSGSTYAGAMIDTTAAALMKGSFSSKYNNAGGPAKMENLKIELVRSIDPSTLK